MNARFVLFQRRDAAPSPAPTETGHPVLTIGATQVSSFARRGYSLRQTTSSQQPVLHVFQIAYHPRRICPVRRGLIGVFIRNGPQRNRLARFFHHSRHLATHRPG